MLSNQYQDFQAIYTQFQNFSTVLSNGYQNVHSIINKFITSLPCYEKGTEIS